MGRSTSSKFPPVDANAGPPAAALQKLGAARVILATAPDSNAISALVEGLGPNGKLVVIGASQEALGISPNQLLMQRRSIQGWSSGTAKDSEDTLQFSVLTGVRPIIERYPLEKAGEAYARMLSRKARFRVVLTINN